MSKDESQDVFPRLLTAKEVMEILRVSRTTLWQLTRRHAIGSYKVGGESRYAESDVRAYLASIRRDPKPDPDAGEQDEES